jgi:hypothetical protein
MSFIGQFSARTAVHPLMQAYYSCDVGSKEDGAKLEVLFRMMEDEKDLHLFVVNEESFFLEDVNALLAEYPEGVNSHYSMRLSRIAYDVAEKLHSIGHREAKSYREWAPKVEKPALVA